MRVGDEAAVEATIMFALVPGGESSVEPVSPGLRREFLMSIHPTAVVDPTASVGSDVEIGAFSVVGAHVTLGDRVRLHAHVVIEPHTTLGDRLRGLQRRGAGRGAAGPQVQGRDELSEHRVQQHHPRTRHHPPRRRRGQRDAPGRRQPDHGLLPRRPQLRPGQRNHDGQHGRPVRPRSRWKTRSCSAASSASTSSPASGAWR